MIKIASARTTALGTTTDNPFIAWDNLAATATLGGAATLTDGAASNAVDGNTYDYWLPNVTGATCSFRVTFGAARTISFVGIAAHNLATLGLSAQVQRSTDGGATWLAAGAGSAAPTDDSPVGWRMVTTGADAADWRILISGTSAGMAVQIGVVFFGDDLVFPQRFYQGFSPVISPTEVQLQSNVSAGGNLLGSSVVRRGSTLQAPFRNIDPTFVRSSMAGLIPHFNEGGGVFFAWRPATYSEDLHYAWREGDVIRPANSDVLNLMTFNLAMRVHEQ
jgi:hypothetical protein